MNNVKNPVTSENNATVELLSEMYRNVTMGSENLASVIPMIKNKFLLSNVTSQIESYADYTKKTEKQLEKRSVKPKEPSLMKKVMSRSGIAMNTMFDDSDAHIAEMIDKGTRTGVEMLEEKRGELTKLGCDDEVCSLCGEIIKFERGEIDKIKDYMN